MTARGIMKKYPAVEALVERAVKDAQERNLNSDQGIRLLAKRMKEKDITSKKMPILELAEEFWIA